MAFSVENVCGLLIRGKLMTPDEMKAMYGRWQADTKHLDNRQAADLHLFRKWLVANKYVTEYQAGLLLKGHADGFFLNQYKILERVGRGRMAGVYRAAHPLGQTVAVKVLPPSRAKDAQVLGRFQREAELSLQLKHPNVVRSFQVGLAGELHYLVMELLDGETLDDVLQRRKRLPPAEAVRVVHQALQGLQHIHEQGMVHRDLKPANLMLVFPPGAGDANNTLPATVKILDIGLGRQLFDENQHAVELDGLTTENVLLGTPDYLAPEQARDARTIDIRADVYSLGCVLYHALAGSPPFPDKNILSQLVRHATEKARPLRDCNPQVPDGLQQIVDWMMAKKPDERYSTPARAAQALEMFLLADSAPTQRIEDAPQMRSFLTWLETGAATKDGAEKRAPEAAAVVAAPALPAPPEAAPRTDPTPPPREAVKKRQRPKVDEIVTAPAAAVAAAPIPAAPALVPAAPDAAPFDVDVDLIDLPVTPRGLQRAKPQRKWIWIGVAVGVALFLAIVATVLVLAFAS